MDETEQLIDIPKILEITQCPRDGLVLLRGRWQPFEPLKVVKSLAKARGEIDFWDVIPAENAIDVDVSGWLRPGLQKRERHRLELKIKKQLCDVHAAASGGYWEALLQLRGGWTGECFHFAEHRLAELEQKDRWAFHRDKPVKGGLDIYTGSKQAAWKVAQEMKNRLGAKIIKSTTLVGRKGGKQIRRLTIVVRFPEKFEPEPNI